MCVWSKNTEARLGCVYEGISTKLKTNALQGYVAGRQGVLSSISSQ